MNRAFKKKKLRAKNRGSPSFPMFYFSIEGVGVDSQHKARASMELLSFFDVVVAICYVVDMNYLPCYDVLY